MSNISGQQPLPRNNNAANRQGTVRRGIQSTPGEISSLENSINLIKSTFEAHERALLPPSQVVSEDTNLLDTSDWQLPQTKEIGDATTSLLRDQCGLGSGYNDHTGTTRPISETSTTTIDHKISRKTINALLGKSSTEAVIAKNLLPNLTFCLGKALFDPTEGDSVDTNYTITQQPDQEGMTRQYTTYSDTLLDPPHIPAPGQPTPEREMKHEAPALEAMIQEDTRLKSMLKATLHQDLARNSSQVNVQFLKDASGSSHLYYKGHWYSFAPDKESALLNHLKSQRPHLGDASAKKDHLPTLTSNQVYFSRISDPKGLLSFCSHHQSFQLNLASYKAKKETITKNTPPDQLDTALSTLKQTYLPQVVDRYTDKMASLNEKLTNIGDQIQTVSDWRPGPTRRTRLDELQKNKIKTEQKIEELNNQLNLYPFLSHLIG